MPRTRVATRSPTCRIVDGGSTRMMARKRRLLRRTEQPDWTRASHPACPRRAASSGGADSAAGRIRCRADRVRSTRWRKPASAGALSRSWSPHSGSRAVDRRHRASEVVRVEDGRLAMTSRPVASARRESRAGQPCRRLLIGAAWWAIRSPVRRPALSYDWTDGKGTAWAPSTHPEHHHRQGTAPVCR